MNPPPAAGIQENCRPYILSSLAPISPWLQCGYLPMVVMRARLVKIGNSRGLRLAKPLLEQAGLSDEVDIQAAPGLLTIRPVVRPRAGWAAAAAAVPPEGLLDVPSATRFDDDEWQW